MIISRGICIIDAYFSGIAESTWKTYKSGGWNMFVRFLVEENRLKKKKMNVRKCILNF
jgi:hypothetical protein